MVGLIHGGGGYVGMRGFAGGGPPARTTVTGATVGVDVTGAEKVWRTFQSLGDIAFAYAFSTVLIEIQV